MTVLYDHQIFSSQPLGGISRYFAELIRESEGAGYACEFGWDFTSNRYLLEQNAGHRDWAPQWPFRGKAHLTGLWNSFVSTSAVRKQSWDVLHPTYYNPHFLGLLGERPFVLTIHDMIHERYPDGLSDRNVVPQRKRLLAERAHRVIAVSENTKADIVQYLGLSPDKIVTIPHGNSLRPDLVEPTRPPIEPGYWLYVGGRHGYKNWDLVIEAIARRDQSERLVMVGGGALTDDEQRKISRVGLSHRVLQVNASDSGLAGWYQCAKALVYPSLYEGFGMPLLEAMAWNCPVVAARASCLPEVAGDAALYFDPTSVESLTDALRQVSEPEVANDLVVRGLEHERPFRWDRTARATAEVYRSCL